MKISPSMSIAAPVINRPAVACAVIILVSLCIYLNALPGDFVWDDTGLILNHTGYLKDPGNIITAFTQPFFGATPFYRPCLILSFISDYQLWGENPFGYHFTNLLVHIVNACMVYLVVLLLVREARIALAAGLLFAAHPAQSEGIAWISGRNDLLLTFFSLVTLLLSLRWEASRTFRSLLIFCGIMIAYAVTLLTKESGLILFLLIGLTDLFFPGAFRSSAPARRTLYLCFIVISCLFIYLRMYIIGSLGLGSLDEPLSTRLLRVFLVYTYYFKTLLFPIRQTANPFIPYVTTLADPVFIRSFLFMAGLAVAAALCWKYFRFGFFAILWIIISLLPTSGIVPLIYPALEHRLSLALVAFSLAVPALILRTERPSASGRHRIPSVLLILILCLYCTKTVLRNPAWMNEMRLWTATVQTSPLSLPAHANLGIAYMDQGEYHRALSSFKQALALATRPELGSSTQRKFQGGFVYTKIGYFFLRIIKDNQDLNQLDGPRAASAAALAREYGLEGLYQESFLMFTRALRLYKKNATTYNGLGEYYSLKKEYDQAIQQYLKAIKHDPYNGDTYNNVGLAYYHMQQYEPARDNFLQAISLKPTSDAENNLGLAYYHLMDYPAALAALLRALAMKPDSAEIHYNLALVYGEGFNEVREAIGHLKESLRLDPDHPRAIRIRQQITNH